LLTTLKVPPGSPRPYRLVAGHGTSRRSTVLASGIGVAAVDRETVAVELAVVKPRTVKVVRPWPPKLLARPTPPA
jgi:hypothetical protein